MRLLLHALLAGLLVWLILLTFDGAWIYIAAGALALAAICCLVYAIGEICLFNTERRYGPRYPKEPR